MPGGKNDRSKFVSNHTHFSTTDADARISVKPGKARQLNYLAQVSVDTAIMLLPKYKATMPAKKTASAYRLY